MSLDEQIGINTQENATREPLGPDNLKTKIIIGLVLGLFVLIVLIVVSSPKVVKPKIKPIITPPLTIVTSTPPPQLSRWASDAAVLKIDNDNRDLNNKIINTDLAEPALSLPNVDMNVDFQK